MLELLLAILTYMYGKHKACTDALRDYKLDMKMYVKSLQDPADVSHLRAWLVGGTVWDAVRKCKLPVFCADAWHYYDDTKYLILSLSMVLGWLAGQGLIHSFHHLFLPVRASSIALCSHLGLVPISRS